jgi:hypothetical protein
LFKEEWTDFIIGNITCGNLTREIWKTNFKNGKKLDITAFEIK